MILLKVIGTPVEAEWPEESSVLRSNFSYARGRGVGGILAELDPQVRFDGATCKDIMQRGSGILAELDPQV